MAGCVGSFEFAAWMFITLVIGFLAGTIITLKLTKKAEIESIR